MTERRSCAIKMPPDVPDIGRYILSWTDGEATNILHNTLYIIFTQHAGCYSSVTCDDKPNGVDTTAS